ncbi:hypothetical protein SAY87_001841 [Trapa incisa]|uniref:Coiled-coil domain-containing protein R3HCC1L n=1 Tax=Trapa incisa TaxID=236973 RepID=A0AAN7PSZ5_9MYRT|nr:hypothetical protein SAY87_001841 [Trapa incisa]
MEAREESNAAAAASAADAYTDCSWSEEVEDLLAAGNRDAAISRLETLVSELSSQKNSSSTALQLSSALKDLARIYSSNGFSLKADQLHARALIVKERVLHPRFPSEVEVDGKEKVQPEDPAIDLPGRNPLPDDSPTLSKGQVELPTELPHTGKDASISNLSSDDDWEAMADREPNDLLPVSSECLSELSKLSVEDKKSPGPKRRGRGTFSYRNRELYSDQLSDDFATDEEKEDSTLNSEENTVDKRSKYGTHHVLVLTDFPPSTRTMELEKIMGDFKDCGMVIRWVNDTTALAVFRTPATAFEACNSIQFPFTARILDEDDPLISLIPVRDLEPPRQRPQTSARTAQRLIAQVMGLKLPSTSSVTREFRQQEEARKDRIIRRQKLRDDAWGAD